MFGLYGLFDECPESTIINRTDLLYIAETDFHPLASTILEEKHSFTRELLRKLDIENPEFENQYYCIIAGTIIYALAHESSYYFDSKGSVFNFYPVSMEKLFEHCDVPAGASINHKELIVKLGKKAVEEGAIPFDEETIEAYFGKRTGSMKAMLLNRFQISEAEQHQISDQKSWCTLF